MENQHAEVSPEGQRKRLEDKGLETVEAVTVLASAQNLYTFWLNPQNFMAFTEQLESVTKISDTKSHWKWKALRGNKTLEWDSEIVEKKPYSVIAWRSTHASQIQLSGRVEFKPLDYGRGTVVTVRIAFDVPGGKFTEFIEKMLGESPHRNLKMNLVTLRELFEAGEIPRVEGQPAGADRKHETKTALH